MALGRFAQRIADRSGLDARGCGGGIDVEHTIKVLGAVDDQRRVDALSAHRRAGATRQDGRAMLAAKPDRGDDIVERARQHDADGHLPIVRRVGGVRRARCRVETDFTRKRRAEGARKSLKSYHSFGFWHSAPC
jgi:hypothetical protein